MKKYEYLEEVKDQVIELIKDNYEKGDLVNFDDVYEESWVSDSVTGNASGSYFCNSYKAREALGSDVAELVEEVEAEFGPIKREKLYDWEFIDVSVRCLVLHEAVTEAFDELQDDFQFVY